MGLQETQVSESPWGSKLVEIRIREGALRIQGRDIPGIDPGQESLCHGKTVWSWVAGNEGSGRY